MENTWTYPWELLERWRYNPIRHGRQNLCEEAFTISKQFKLQAGNLKMKKSKDSFFKVFLKGNQIVVRCFDNCEQK